jgi:hypothetical protein
LSKIDRIIDEPLLMQHLRVCNRRFEHCGKCHSCQFMLAAFDVLGARDKAPTYSHIAPGPVSLRVTGEGSLSDLTKMRAAALKSGSHGDIVAAIDHALSRYRYRKGFQRLLPVDEAARRFKRLKHKRRFDRAVRGSG